MRRNIAVCLADIRNLQHEVQTSARQSPTCDPTCPLVSPMSPTCDATCPMFARKLNCSIEQSPLSRGNPRHATEHVPLSRGNSQPAACSSDFRATIAGVRSNRPRCRTNNRDMQREILTTSRKCPRCGRTLKHPGAHFKILSNNVSLDAVEQRTPMALNLRYV
jgi:hypothetical protein